MVAEFMYSANQVVQPTPISSPAPNDLIERRFIWLFEELTEIQQSTNIISLADGIGDLVYIALGASLELGTIPHPEFKTLQGFLRKCEQLMRVRGHEISYIPQTIRKQTITNSYLSRLLKLVSKFPTFTDVPTLNTCLETIIETACEFSLYLGLHLSPIFDEIHSSNMTKFVDGHSDPLDGKWRKGPSWRPPNLEHLIFTQE
jgi:hypothetical protein